MRLDVLDVLSYKYSHHFYCQHIENESVADEGEVGGGGGVWLAKCCKIQ